MECKVKDAFLCHACSCFMNETIGMEEFQITVSKFVRGLGGKSSKSRLANLSEGLVIFLRK